MLQVARLSPKLLGESASLVEGFLHSQQNPDGGFGDREGFGPGQGVPPGAPGDDGNRGSSTDQDSGADT